MSRAKTILMLLSALFLISNSFAQGLPPGWEYTVTGDNHTISIMQAPIINGVPIEVGDYIGVFYINDEGGETCGGAVEWTGGSGAAISAFGDDNLTSVKDGFAYNEEFIFRIYSWCGEIEYTGITAIVAPVSFNGLNWLSNGLTSLQMVFGSGASIHTVSGSITSGSSPLEGVEVTFSNGVSATYTDADGNYTRCVPDGWSGDITPVSSTYTFDPVSISLSNVTAPSTDNDFSTSVPTVNISGTITQDGTGLAGVTVTFSNGGGTTVTTSSGTYSKDLDSGWSGTATPSLAGKTFSPTSRSYSNVTSDQTDQDYTATDITYTVSGYVTDNGAPVENVEMQLTGLTSVYTDASGAYIFSAPHGWSGTIIPVKAGYEFIPAQRNITTIYSNLSGLNFAATIETFAVTGTITDDSSNPLEGVTVSFSGSIGGALTNASGFYTKNVPYDYTGTATPSLAGYNFTPVSRNYSNITAAISGEDYEGEQETYTISGTVTEGGLPLEGVTISFSNGGGDVVTDASGFYSNTLPYGWIGTSTPSLAGKEFSPSSRAYAGLFADQTDQYFLASVAMISLSGNIVNSSGNPIQNVEVLVSGQSSVFTDTYGDFDTEVEYGWTGTFQPQKAGYDFTPGIRNIVNATTNQANLDFTGTIQVLTVAGTIQTSSGSPVDGVSVIFSNGGGTVLTNATGEYTKNLNYGYSGVATPELLGYSFVPTHRTYSNLTQNRLSDHYTATEQTVIISGYINDTDMGTPIEDVVVFFNNGGGSDTTDYEGYYAMELPYGWSGTAYPDKDDYTFSPTSRSYSEVQTNLFNNNYEGTQSFTPPGWNVVPTDISHVISIPIFSHPKINGTQIAIGDYIGVFYWDEASQTEKCGGFCEWTGSNAVTAFGDDASSSNKDGFYENEKFRWRIHKMFNSTDYEAIATYHAVNPYTFDGKYHTNALSELITLNADDLTVEVWPEQTQLCQGNNIILSASPGGGSGNYVFEWSSIPPGFTSTQTQVIVSPSATTVYRCDVYTYLSSVSDNATVNVIDQPVAPISITSDRDGFCANDAGTISLTANGGSGETLRWLSQGTEIGTGNPLVLDSPEVTTTYCAQYENNCGISTCTEVTVTVLPMPVAPTSVAATDYEVCINDPGTLDLTATGGSGDVLNWYANGTFAGSGTPLTVDTPEEETTYCAQWESTCGTTLCESLTVTVIPLPEPPQNVSATPSEVCADDNGTITLTAEGGSGDEVNWYFNGSYFGTGTSIILMSPEETSTYHAQWENSCANSDLVPVTVNVLPLAVAPESVISTASEVCIDDQGTVTLTAVGGSGDIIRWFVDDLEAGTGADLTVASPEVTTTYCAVWENSCGSSECTPFTIEVLPLPEAPAVVSVSDSDVCINDPGMITLVAEGGSGEELKWFVNDVYIGSGSPLAVDSPEMPTTYCAAWENSCGISDCVSVSVSIIDLPVAPENVYASVSEVCINDQGQIALYAQGGSGETIAWYVDSQLVGTGSPLFVDSPEEETTYCAQWQNECAVSECVSTTVTILPLPEAPTQVTASQTEVCINDQGNITLTATGGSGDVLYWYEGNDLIGTGSSVEVPSPEVNTSYCARWENTCGISDCESVAVNVIPLPESPVSVSATPDAVCYTDAGTVTLTAVGGSGDLLNWYAGGISVGTGSTLVIDSPEVTTDYCASWENVCSTSSCVSVTVVAETEPVAPDSLTSDRNGFCPQDDGDITLTVHGGYGDLVTWYEGSCGSTAIGTGITITIPSPEDTTTYYASRESLCGISACAEVTVNVVDTCQSVHVITMPEGWSGISSWVMPDDTVTENIFAPIIDDLVILKDLTGVFWPPYANTLPYWNTMQGYKVKVDATTQLTFTGDPADDLSIDLDQGWSLIPVLTEDAVTAASVFGPLEGNLVIVKSVASPEVYWPAAQFYSLQTLEPGKAYMVALENPGELDYSLAATAKSLNPVVATVNPWNEISPTGTSHVIAIPSSTVQDFNAGDVLGVFNADGLCVGAVMIPQGEENLAITVYGDDATTVAIDGMRENEVMQFRLWDSKSESQISLETEFDEAYSSGANFKTDGLGAVKAFTKLTGQLEHAMLNVNLYPVPAKEQLFVEVSVNSSYAIQVFTLSGRKLMEQNECLGKTILNTEALQPGMYMLRIRNDQGTVVRRFVIGN